MHVAKPAGTRCRTWPSERSLTYVSSCHFSLGWPPRYTARIATRSKTPRLNASMHIFASRATRLRELDQARCILLPVSLGSRGRVRTGRLRWLPPHSLRACCRPETVWAQEYVHPPARLPRTTRRCVYAHPNSAEQHPANLQARRCAETCATALNRPSPPAGTPVRWPSG